MKRKLKANLDFQITTKLDTKELVPNVAGYSVVVNGNILPFDFGNMPVTVIREGDTLKFSIEQIKLELGIFVPDWIEKGFIPENTPEEDIENLIFNHIKDSSEIGEIYLDIFTGNGDSFYEDEIQITSFVVVDIINDEEIDILAKPVSEDGLFDNLKISNNM